MNRSILTIRCAITLLATLLLLAGCSGPPIKPTIKPGVVAPATPAEPAAAPTITGEPSDGAPSTQVDINTIPNAVPRPEPYSKYGNPSTYEVYGQRYTPLKSSKGHVERGTASWYGTKFHGRRTSSGEPYNLYDMTAAHKTLPLPTYAQVTNLDNGRSIVVKINDRGPFHKGRIIDLSYAAAMKLDIMKTGTGRVEVRTIDPYAPSTHLASPSKTEPTTLASTPGRFLQAGAFGVYDNAENLRNRLSSLTANPVVINKNDQTPPIYRVLIGPLNSDQEARQLADQLTGIGVTETKLVAN